jgi:hypothetical protein
MSTILRIPPYPLSVTYSVPDELADYILVIEDVAEQTELEVFISAESGVTSSSEGKIVYSLTGDFVKYDKSYALTIYEDAGSSGAELVRGDVVVEDNLEIVRPYVNPVTLATSGTATDIAAYTEYENLARMMIDSITGGFYYNRTYLEVVGQGTDYIPLWKKTHKILKAYENAELVYDLSNTTDGPALKNYNYIITKDKTAITKDPIEYVDSLSRAERKYPSIPVAPSDSISLFDTEDSGNVQTIVPAAAFPEGIDCIFLLETGYKVVPVDIADATKLLIEDIKCGKLDYYKRYVKNYSTDQFKIEYDKRMIEGTGNIMVDKILNKYVETIIRPGVL